MLSRIFEWYRIVNVKPSRDVLDLRSKAASDLVGKMDDAKDWDLIMSAAAAVVDGFESGFAQDSPIVQTVVSSIKSHDSAFPQDLSENAIELRVVVAVTLGEVLVRNHDNAPDELAVLVASVIQSGLHARPTQGKRFVQQMIAELSDEASSVLVRAGRFRRQRSAEIDQHMKKIEDASAAETAELGAFIEITKDAMNEFSRQASIDREELNISWWMFAGAASTSGDTISELSLGAAALVCGVELANLCVLPRAQSAEAMVRRAFESGRETTPSKKLSKIVEDWKAPFDVLLAPDDETKATAQEYPQLFPLSWLAGRLVASQGASGWSKEFNQKTGLSASTSYDVVNIAIQAFLERIALRQYFG